MNVPKIDVIIFKCNPNMELLRLKITLLCVTVFRHFLCFVLFWPRRFSLCSLFVALCLPTTYSSVLTCFVKRLDSILNERVCVCVCTLLFQFRIVHSLSVLLFASFFVCRLHNSSALYWTSMNEWIYEL